MSSSGDDWYIITLITTRGEFEPMSNTDEDWQQLRNTPPLVVRSAENLREARQIVQWLKENVGQAGRDWSVANSGALQQSHVYILDHHKQLLFQIVWSHLF